MGYKAKLLLKKMSLSKSFLYIFVNSLIINNQPYFCKDLLIQLHFLSQIQEEQRCPIHILAP